MGLLDNYLPKTGELLADRYRLEEEIGRGAFGVVFRAVQEGLDSEVAIKVLRPRAVDEDGARRRFEREVEIAKSLKHANTIRILDVDVTLKGLPFYVMEYVDGRTLREVLQDDGPLSEERTRSIGIQVCKSLAEAHANGVVHRDLKPANIMLFDLPGEPDVVKVVDFGIAKALGGSESFETAVGSVLGTPYYMSPEQAAGAGRVDARADLYALGIILSDCVGTPPDYEADTAMEHLAVQLSPDPLPFPAQLRSSSLGPTILKATAKSVGARFQTAVEMRTALQEPAPVSVPTLEATSGSKELEPLPPPFGLSRGRVSGAALVAGIVAVAVFVTRPGPSELEPEPVPAAEVESLVVEPNPPIDTVTALALVSVHSALPASAELSFEGTPGTAIGAAGRELGVVPFVARVPFLPAEFEYTATRLGHTSIARGRLNEAVVHILDPVPMEPERAQPPPSRRTEPEVTDDPAPTPFGTAPIHD